MSCRFLQVAEPVPIKNLLNIEVEEFEAGTLGVGVAGWVGITVGDTEAVGAGEFGVRIGFEEITICGGCCGCWLVS